MYGLGAADGLDLATHWEALEWLREHGFRTNPFAERHESIEVGRRGLPRLGDEADRARLRDRRDRDQGRLVRPAAAPERAPRPPALGARLQVGADDRADRTPANPHQSRANRRAQSLGSARAGRGRRRHRLDRDPAQRAGHQPQGHPRRRHGHRPARRRRDPAGRRPGAPARKGLAPLPDAQEVPALRGGDRQARGRGHAPLPEPEMRVARPGDAHQLGLGHRRRRRAGHPAGSGARGSSRRCPISTG